MNQLSRAIIGWQNIGKRRGELREARRLAEFKIDNVGPYILKLVLNRQTDEAITGIGTLDRLDTANLESAARWVSNRCNDHYDEILEAKRYPKP